MHPIDIVRKRLDFENGRGSRLAAALERPAHGTYCYALFAHCFTCGKDITAAARVSRALCQRGIAVLRFDFTGLGGSDGDFANETFSSNVEDLVAAARYLEQHYEAPRLLVGHSLGGAAVLAAAQSIDSATAVATIGAPSDTSHLEHLFEEHELERIEEQGEATVSLAGRSFRIGRPLLRDIARDHLDALLPRLQRALLVMHSPFDKVVGVDHARRIFERAKHPKSFVSLDSADHLLSRRADAEYAATVLAAWASRFLDPEGEQASRSAAQVPEGQVRVQERPDQLERGLAQIVVARTHVLSADEPVKVGGRDTGMTPYELLLAGLGACTSMTMRMYARRKGWPLEGVSVDLSHKRVHAADCADCETGEGRVDVIDKRITIEGPELTDEQRQRIYGIAARCPVHRTLDSDIKLRSTLVSAEAEPEPGQGA